MRSITSLEEQANGDLMEITCYEDGTVEVWPPDEEKFVNYTGVLYTYTHEDGRVQLFERRRDLPAGFKLLRTFRKEWLLQEALADGKFRHYV
jgi:hypothetical protein